LSCYARIIVIIMRAFKRENGLPIFFQGKPVQFEPVSKSRGVLQLDEAIHAPLIAELDRLADARRMGVVRISAEVRADLIQKKTLQKPRRDPRLGQSIRAFSQKASSTGSADSLPTPVAPVVPVKPPPAPAGPVTIKPSPELVEMLKAQGKPVPPPITVSKPLLVAGPKSKANHIPKSQLPKPPADNAAASE
jgi:hypothetical protein